MPLKIIPPREGKSPFYRVRGTHLGRYVDRSTKCTDRATAVKTVQKWKREIESGEFAEKGEPKFAEAALRYIQSGGDTRFLKRVVDNLGPDIAIREMTQERIDQAAREIYPDSVPGHEEPPSLHPNLGRPEICRRRGPHEATEGVWRRGAGAMAVAGRGGETVRGGRQARPRVRRLPDPLDLYRPAAIGGAVSSRFAIFGSRRGSSTCQIPRTNSLAPSI